MIEAVGDESERQEGFAQLYCEAIRPIPLGSLILVIYFLLDII